MRKVIGLSLLLVAGVTSVHAHEFTDRARVLAVTPQVERINQPRQECRTDYVRENVYQSNRSNTGAVVGGVAGGLLGSTVGRGTGRIVAAAVGAGLGAIVGDRVDNQGTYGTTTVVTRPVQSCVTVDQWQSVTTGYLVQYEYQGRQYSTMMDRDPGPVLNVNVGVQPSYGVVQVAPVMGPQVVNPVVWQPPARPSRHHRQYW